MADVRLCGMLHHSKFGSISADRAADALERFSSQKSSVPCHTLLARRDHDERISREESNLLFAIRADDGPIATDRE